MLLENISEWKREVIDTGTASEMRILETELLQAADAMHDSRSFNMHNGNGTFTLLGKESHLKGRKRIYKDGIDKRVKVELVEYYVSIGWNFGSNPKINDKISSALTGKSKPKRSLVHTANQSAARKGVVTWNTGKKETRVDVLEKMSRSKIGNINASKKNDRDRSVVIESMIDSSMTLNTTVDRESNIKGKKHG